MPITFFTFAAGYLAIIGFPFFSGFYSKDHIIEVAFQSKRGGRRTGAARRRRYGVLHDPVDVDDLRSEASAGSLRRPSARVASW